MVAVSKPSGTRLARLFAGRIEGGDAVVRIIRRRRGPAVPQPWLTIAQPEDARPDIGRIVERVADRALLAEMPDGALDFVLMAYGAVIEATRHSGVRDGSPFVHGSSERGVLGDPVIDGA